MPRPAAAASAGSRRRGRHAGRRCGSLPPPARPTTGGGRGPPRRCGRRPVRPRGSRRSAARTGWVRAGSNCSETCSLPIVAVRVSQNSNPEPISCRWLLATLVAWRQEMGPGGFEPKPDGRLPLVGAASGRVRTAGRFVSAVLREERRENSMGPGGFEPEEGVLTRFARSHDFQGPNLPGRAIRSSRPFLVESHGSGRVRTTDLGLVRAAS